MNWIDTHAHLYLEEFHSDQDQILRNAQEAGLSKIVLPNVDLKTIAPMMEVCKKWPSLCIPAIGIHPCSINQNYISDIQVVESQLSANYFCAVGEVGIDLYWDTTFEKEQKEALRIQIELARKFKLPLIIHTRNSFDITFDIIEEYSDLNLVFHCFPGTAEQAKKAISKGYYIGIGGVASFKNALDLHNTIKEIPLEFLVLETDAPYLAPVPHRGKRNESSYIPLIAKRIGEIKHVHLEEVSIKTTENAEKLFNFTKEN